MPGYRIPFNRVSLVGGEADYMRQAVDNGHVSGGGPFSARCERWLAQRLAAPGVLLTTSCTHALELAALLLEIGPDDEVIVPAFTFSSTLNAFVLRGARPVFVDVRPDTLNLDEALIAERITPRTKAIVPVHYAGVGCEMDDILSLAAAHQLAIVEDNAHGLFGSYKGRPLGSFGCLAAQSFHETKNVTCGEGGALVLNDPRLVERAEILREKGTDRSRFFRGQVDKYTWVDVGSSYVLSDILAAFLWGQLERSVEIQAVRKRIWDAYAADLADWAARHGVQLPFVPGHCQQAYHLFYVLMPSLEDRRALIEHLRGRGILGVFHYLPLHLSPMGQRYGGQAGQCPVTEDVSDRLVRLPLYVDLSESEQAAVIEAVTSFEPSRSVVGVGAPWPA